MRCGPVWMQKGWGLESDDPDRDDPGGVAAAAAPAEGENGATEVLEDG